MKINRLKLKVAALGFMLAAALIQTASAVQIANEFWIHPYTTGNNLGTLADPYHGDTATKFDAVMNDISKFPANSVMHILPGTYQTGGNKGWGIRTGQKIVGSGIDVTILQLTNNAPNQSYVLENTNGVASNIEVSDLTADCNYTGTNTITYGGISLWGNRHAIRRVKVINAVGLSVESFLLKINSDQAGNNSEGNIIEECEASSFKGGQCTAINMGGQIAGTWISGVVRNNRVFLSPATSDGPKFGINGGQSINWLVEGNYVNGANTGFYGDTDNYTNVIVAHNTFRNCLAGVYLANGTRKNLSFIYNNIQLTNDPTTGNQPIAFVFESSATNQNVTIAGNNVRVSEGSTGYKMFVQARNVTGFYLNNNSIDIALDCDIQTCTNVSLYDNFDLTGNPLTTLCGNINIARANEAPILGDFKSLIISNQVSDIVNKVGVMADEVVLKNANGAPFLARNVALTINMGSSGANGLDTGSQASSTWYYIWVIYDGVNFAGLLSTSATSPTMPADYDYKALVGAVRNNSNSDFIRFVQRDRDVAVTNQLLFTGITSSSGSTLQSISGTGSKTVELSTIVPPIAKKCRGAIGSSAGLTPYALVVSSDSTFVGSVVLYGATPVTGAYRNFGVSTSFEVLLSIPQDFYWMSSGNNVRLEVSGFSL